MSEVVTFQFYEIKMCVLFIFGFAISLLFVEVSEGTTLEMNLSLKGAEWVRKDVLWSLEADDQFLSVPESPYSLGQFSLGFLDELEVGNQCQELLYSFTIKCVSLVDCTLRHARPVRVCENCYQNFNNLQEIYRNISQESLVNVSCRDTLLRSDRLQVIVSVYEFLNGLWGKSECSRCLTKEDSISNDTINFMNALNQSLDCFQKFQQLGNLSELCKQCKGNYSRLSELYNQMEKNFTLCIDIEDAMNMTRRLWSKNFNCSFPREETVPVIAVSSFMLFLPIIFYLSSFLHSKQKKRKLIPPKRAKSSNNLMNIQDK
ncbi:osteopetrosis-associated transmembrane protein 1 [Polyodon spathula]|uniref:osteopetrosis-associated transmembrane protein 1 n=1 Tax=Polyodon spathula TaxID=7913 RepID=UPI001B7F0CC6|nr:osteopetrosis-associated transmembrane protein 1 [Polyodon spathula]